MDYSSFDKTKLWLNIVGCVCCLFMAAYLLISRVARSDVSGAMLFLVFAINCAFRIYSYYKLERARKTATSETEMVRTERRQGLIIGIFSNATAIALMLLLVIEGILRNSRAVVILSAVFALCFAGILVQSIRNLKRFDRT